MKAADLRTTVRIEVEDDGGVLSNIRNGTNYSGMGMVTTFVQATGNARFNGFASWFGK